MYVLGGSPASVPSTSADLNETGPQQGKRGCRRQVQARSHQAMRWPSVDAPAHKRRGGSRLLIMIRSGQSVPATSALRLRLVRDSYGRSPLRQPYAVVARSGEYFPVATRSALTGSALKRCSSRGTAQSESPFRLQHLPPRNHRL
jgi:hypothetical protein